MKTSRDYFSRLGRSGSFFSGSGSRLHASAFNVSPQFFAVIKEQNRLFPSGKLLTSGFNSITRHYSERLSLVFGLRELVARDAPGNVCGQVRVWQVHLPRPID
jgi:hypothetical protein